MLKGLAIKAKGALSSLGHQLKKTFLHPSMGMKTFYLMFIVAIGCFIYTWVTHYFTVPLSGDYTLQEMTFLFNGYDDWHTFFRTGKFPTWDSSIFLGIDNIGGNSFYYLFDPFVLILLPFPRDWLLVLQGLEFVPKLVLGGMFFYWFLGDFKLSPKVRMIGALCYGFSGYAFGYLWFHFIDSCAFWPLILLGVERTIFKRDLRILLVGFFLNALASYFFFVVFMFGGFFYWCFRYLQTIKERSKDENFAALGCGFLGFFISIFLGCLTLIPGMVVAKNMPRVSNQSSWMNTIKEAEGLKEIIKAIFTWQYGSTQTKFTPLLNFLFMPTGCYYSNLLNVYWYDNFASSLYPTAPMLLMVFTSLIYSFKKRKISHIIGVLLNLLLVLTPIGYYLFSGFTVGYARFFIVPLSWLIIYGCIAIANRRDISRKSFDLAFVMLLLLDLAALILLMYAENKYYSYLNGNEYNYWDVKMIQIPLMVIWLTGCYLLLRPLFHKKQFNLAMALLCAVDIIAMANITIIFQGTSNINTMAGGPDNIKEETKIVQLLKESEDYQDYYRIFNPTANRNNINISLREGYNGLGAFHSVYPFGAQDFLDRSRIPYSYHNWSMGVHNRRNNMETFLGTKYYMVPKVDLNYQPYQVKFTDYDIPYGYVNVLDLTSDERKELNVDYSEELLSYLSSSNCKKSLYVNKYFVDTFFPFDSIVNAHWLASSYSTSGTAYFNYYEDINEYPLLRAAMLDDEDYQIFAKKKAYNAGTFTANNVTTVLDGATAKENVTKFVSAISSTTEYLEGKTSPIQVYTGPSRLGIKVYGANWPATEKNPSGEYAYWDLNNPSDRSGITKEWINSHKLEYANGINPADNKYDYYNYTDDDGNKKEEYSRYVLYYSKVVLTPMKGGVPTTVCTNANPADKDSGCYISIKNTNNISWRLFDEEDKLISIGQHSYSNYKNAHGYYTDRPVKTIVGVIYQGNKDNPADIGTQYSSPIQLHVQRNKDYKQAVTNLIENKPEIISRSSDRIEFKTNYDHSKFMVLNYPKQNGWKLYRKFVETLENGKKHIRKVEVTQYKAQGGFIGFETGTGEYTYILEYESPYLNIALYAEGFGILVSLFFFAYYSMRNKQKAKAKILSLSYQGEEYIKQANWDYLDCVDNSIRKNKNNKKTK